MGVKNKSNFLKIVLDFFETRVIIMELVVRETKTKRKQAKMLL